MLKLFIEVDMHKNLINEKFGRWVVLSQGPKKNTHYSWVCKCECGTTREVLGIHLKNGKTKSCGCLKIENNVKRLTTHGKSKFEEYSVWNRIINRCTNPNSPDWENYGGRGIKVSDDWRHNFELFFLDMGKRPSKNHSIDRINNDGNYEKENCRWSTPKEQARNTRRNTIVNLNDKKMSLAEAAEILNLNYNCAKWRFETHGTLTNDKKRKFIGQKETNNLGA